MLVLLKYSKQKILAMYRFVSLHKNSLQRKSLTINYASISFPLLQAKRFKEKLVMLVRLVSTRKHYSITS